MARPIAFDLDDFCEELATDEAWDMLRAMKIRWPGLKLTMFTIPLRCTLPWLRYVSKIPWLELHYHGSTHEDRDEWFQRTEIELPYQEFFYRGFKAPWWRMDQTTADTLDRMGFLISASRECFPIQARRVYRFNEGRCVIPGVYYRHRAFDRIHSHIQHQKDGTGLPDLFDRLLVLFPTESQFKFVSEVVP